MIRWMYEPTRMIYLSLFLLMLSFSLTACQGDAYTIRGSPYEQPVPAPDITAPSTAGWSFRLSDLRGQPVLLFFGYTHCPDVCPATLAKMSWVFKQLGEKADRVAFVFISVDPQRDSLERIHRHLQPFDPRFVGLRMEAETLAATKEAYGVYAAKSPEGGSEEVLLTHTARIFLVDPLGRLRTNYDFATPREEILADLEYLLDS